MTGQLFRQNWKTMSQRRLSRWFKAPCLGTQVYPVKRGLVKEPEDWLYSSARNFAGKENNFEVDKLEN